MEQKGKKLIVQVGHYPPPIGGVSNYIKRIKENLDSRCVQNQVWDISRIAKDEKNILNMPLRFISVPFYILYYKNINIIHYNIRGNLIKNYIGIFNNLFFKNRKKIITIHGNAKNIFKRKEKLIKIALNSFDAIICVKKNDKEFLKKQGILTNLFEIPPFIPPIDCKKDLEEIPTHVWNYIKSHTPLIYANASEVSVINGIDLYGIDMCIELCYLLKKIFNKIGFIFFISSIKNKKYFKKLQDKVIKESLEKHFIFVTKGIQIYPLIKKTDLFLRPTSSDGDAISIREALYYKIPVLASNAVGRPRGTITFKNRNIKDLTEKTKMILKDLSYYKAQMQELKIKNNFVDIHKIYKYLSQ